MTLALACFNTGESQKRKFEVLKESEDNSIGEILFLATSSTNQPIESKIGVSKVSTSSTTPLVSSCSSTSCEESCSSNYSEQAFSEEPAEPYTTSVETHCDNTRKEGETKRYPSSQSKNDQDDSSSSSDSHRRGSKVRGQIAAALIPPHSNFWDESTSYLSTSTCSSSNKKKGNNTVATSSATTMTIDVITPTTCTHPRNSTVEGLMFATPNPFHSERTTWEDTNWHLPTLTSARKKRKTLGTMTITTEKDTSNDDRDSDTTNNERGNCQRRWKRRSRQGIFKECNIPRNDDSVQWKLWKRMNEPDDKEQQNHHLQVPIITHRGTRIMQPKPNQPLGDHQLSSMDSPYVLYRWLRVRLAAGLVRSSFDFLHRILKKYYYEAKKVLKKVKKKGIQKDELVSLTNLRDRLAGIWCVYAHFTLEVGCLALAGERENSSSQKKYIYTSCMPPSSKITTENNRTGSTKADLNLVGMAGGIELPPCSKNTKITRNFDDEQDTAAIPSDINLLQATSESQPIRNLYNAVEDSQPFSNSSKNSENTTTSFVTMLAAINGGKDLGFMDYMKIRTAEEFEAAPIEKLSEEYYEYRKRNCTKGFINVRSAKTYMYNLKRMVREFSNLPAGKKFKKRQSPKEMARRVSLENVFHEEKKEGISSKNKDMTYDDIYDHAISVLLAARDCPLVGNHTAIAVSLGRIIVSSTVMEHAKADYIRVELSREILSAKIQSAIDVCWDNIDTCRGELHQNKRFATKPVSNKTIRSLSNFEVKNQKLLTEKRIGKHVIKEGIKSTLLLPMTLRSFLSSTSLSSEGMVVGDRDTIRSLCVELNRWSRLGEELEINPRRTIRLAPSYDSKQSYAAEKLPLFAPLESLSDPLNHYEDAVGAGKGVIWQW